MAVSLVGNGDFAQTAPERFITNAWDMDRLIVPFRGWHENLEDFIASNSDWDASDIDDNFFLFEIGNADTKRFPTVELTYLGKREGTLPQDKSIQQQSVQQVRYVGYASPSMTPLASGYIAVDPGTPPEFVGTVTLDVTYTALAKGIITWARDDDSLDITDIGDSIGFDGEINIDYSSREVTMTLDNWPPDWPVIDPSDESAVEGLLFLDTVTTGDIEELVPGEYFRATAMVQSLLLPDPPTA